MEHEKHIYSHICRTRCHLYIYKNYCQIFEDFHNSKQFYFPLYSNNFCGKKYSFRKEILSLDNENPP